MKKIISSLFVCAACGIIFLFCQPVKAEVYNYDLIQNGDFEDFLDNWTYDPNIVNDGFNIEYDQEYEGLYCVLGSDKQYNPYEYIVQTINLPSGADNINFSFYYNNHTYYDSNDYFAIFVQDTQTEEFYLTETINGNEDETYGWTKRNYDLTAFAGKTVNIAFAVFNNDAPNDMQMDIDDIKVQVKSYPELYGSVKYSNGNKVKNAKVIIKQNSTGDILWTGYTDNKGKFYAPDLRKGKIKVTIKKGNVTAKGAAIKLKWGKSYDNWFKLWI